MSSGPKKGPKNSQQPQPPSPGLLPGVWKVGLGCPVGSVGRLAAGLLNSECEGQWSGGERRSACGGQKGPGVGGRGGRLPHLPTCLASARAAVGPGERGGSLCAAHRLTNHFSFWIVHLSRGGDKTHARKVCQLGFLTAKYPDVVRPGPLGAQQPRRWRGADPLGAAGGRGLPPPSGRGKGRVTPSPPSALAGPERGQRPAPSAGSQADQMPGGVGPGEAGGDGPWALSLQCITSSWPPPARTHTTAPSCGSSASPSSRWTWRPLGSRCGATGARPSGESLCPLAGGTWLRGLGAGGRSPPEATVGASSPQSVAVGRGQTEGKGGYQ